MPLYRLENYFFGKAKISRQRMSNWVIGVARALKPLDSLIVAEIRAGPVQRHDETRVQVVSSRDEEGRHGRMWQGWMWVAIGGAGGWRAVRFKYADTYEHDTVVEYLDGFKGYIQTDRYRAYDCALGEYPEVVHVGCFAHARRRLRNYIPIEAEKNGEAKRSAGIGLKYMRELYAIESELCVRFASGDISGVEFLEQRREWAEPVLEEFRGWLDKHLLSRNETSLMGKAVGYAGSQWSKVTAYLDCVELTPDNNVSENAIRPFVIGRKMRKLYFRRFRRCFFNARRMRRVRR